MYLILFNFTKVQTLNCFNHRIIAKTLKYTFFYIFINAFNSEMIICNFLFIFRDPVGCIFVFLYIIRANQFPPIIYFTSFLVMLSIKSGYYFDSILISVLLSLKTPLKTKYKFKTCRPKVSERPYFRRWLPHLFLPPTVPIPTFRAICNNNNNNNKYI